MSDGDSMYRVISVSGPGDSAGETLNELEDFVNAQLELSEGWRLCGGIAVVKLEGDMYRYIQAIKKASDN